MSRYLKKVQLSEWALELGPLSTYLHFLNIQTSGYCRILEVYLNVAETGPQLFGVEAASRQYFKIAAKDLSAEQSALIAAVLPNPIAYRIEAPSTFVRQRQQWIGQQMTQLGGLAYLKDVTP